MTIGGFFIVLFVVIGLYGLFKKDDCTITEEDIPEIACAVASYFAAFEGRKES